MVQTINAEIRNFLRLTSTTYSDDAIENKIERAHLFLNERTGETYAIADYSSANTSSSAYDELIIYYALWHIHVEIYKLGIQPADAQNRSGHLSNVYRALFFDHLAASFPNLVRAGGGKLMFTDNASSDTDVGYTDSRFDDAEGIGFDRTV